jgi:8-oxo-dGTP pyrophosphatase MutT (NUDIX family)
MNSPKNICLNCGKQGHKFKSCDEPIISYGIVCFNMVSIVNNKQIKNYFYNKFLDITEFNYTNLNNLNLIPHFYDKIKILMVRRKQSLNYIEFVRGKYDLYNIQHLAKIFSLMTREENLKILSSNFDELWNEIWKETAKSKIYQKEFNLSKLKFEELKENNFFNLLEDSKLSQYNEPEWGFPKGRRNSNEKNLNCAIREFIEETNIYSNYLHILERLNCITEEYVGTNSVNYRHIYYVASTNEEIEIELDVNNENQLEEIGDIKWFTIPEAINKIRPYYEKRIQMIHQIYFFLINLVVDMKGVNKQVLKI